MESYAKKIEATLFVIAINFFLPFSCITAFSSSVKEQNEKELYHNRSTEFLNKSEVVYKPTKVKVLHPTDLVIFQIDQFAVSPFLYVSQEKNGESAINMSIPQPEIASLFEKAAIELQNDNLEEVKNLYQQAYNIDSFYFKTASNLGDAWSFLGDYGRAEFYLKKAIQLNNAGYQEYLFLADVYDKMGKNNDALEAITYAFMLNKNNPYLLQCLKRILAKNNLSIKEDRLEFPFSIRKTGLRECEIQYGYFDGMVWETMANCLACWKMETELQMKLNGEDMFTYKANMYKECLLNQGIFLDEMKRGGGKLSAKEETFLKKIKEKFINPIVYWEIIAGEEPYVMFLLPDNERSMVLKYIRKYVYQ